MDAFVADASIAIAWVHPAQATEATAMWLNHFEAGALLIVPNLWPLEVANVLLTLSRRGRLTTQHRLWAQDRLSTAAELVDADSARIAFTHLGALADEHVLSIYHASYLELALRRKVPLATKDGALNRAAERCKLRTEP